MTIEWHICEEYVFEKLTERFCHDVESVYLVRERTPVINSKIVDRLKQVMRRQMTRCRVCRLRVVI